MPRIRVFLDSSALIAGVLSSTGAERVLLVMSENGQIEGIISEQVIVESERSIAIKSPRALPGFRQTIKDANLTIVQDPNKNATNDNFYLISDPNDVAILLAAMRASVDYLATHDRKHFLDDSKVAENSGLRIGTPGDALAWLRENL